MTAALGVVLDATISSISSNRAPSSLEGSARD